MFNLFHNIPSFFFPLPQTKIIHQQMFLKILSWVWLVLSIHWFKISRMDSMICWRTSFLLMKHDPSASISKIKMTNMKRETTSEGWRWLIGWLSFQRMISPPYLACLVWRRKVCCWMVCAAAVSEVSWAKMTTDKQSNYNHCVLFVLGNQVLSLWHFGTFSFCNTGCLLLLNISTSIYRISANASVFIYLPIITITIISIDTKL